MKRPEVKSGRVAFTRSEAVRAAMRYAMRGRYTKEAKPVAPTYWSGRSLEQVLEEVPERVAFMRAESVRADGELRSGDAVCLDDCAALLELLAARLRPEPPARERGWARLNLNVDRAADGLEYLLKRVIEEEGELPPVDLVREVGRLLVSELRKAPDESDEIADLRAAMRYAMRWAESGR